MRSVLNCNICVIIIFSRSFFYMLSRVLVILTSIFIVYQLSGQELMHVKIDSINSPYDEFNPAVSPDGQTIYLTRRGHSQNVAGVIDLGDIWYAERTSSGWTRLKHGGATINHQGLNGVVGFSADGERMYLLNYFDPDGNGGGNLRNGIAVSRRVNGEWSTPERIQITYFQNKSTHLSATISRDEIVLILAMESYVTEGNEDLYVSFKQQDGTWTQPESLGNTINTYGQELTPFLADDNRTLYFSNNTREGLGGRDIYMSVREEGSWTNWSEPMNMGPALNTEGIEMGFYLPKGSVDAYFSTTQNSEGKGDIFTFAMSMPAIPKDSTVLIVEEVPETVLTDSLAIEAEVPIDLVPKLQPTQPAEVEDTPPMVVMTFQVLDIETEEPVTATVTMTGDRDKVSFNTADLEEEQKFMKAFPEGDTIKVEIKAAGYLDYSEEFIAAATPRGLDDEFGTAVEAFRMIRKQVGTSVKIENVFFKRGSASFLEPDVAHQQIDQLVTLMNKNLDAHIRLEGHTDASGDESLLKALSEERVKTVKRYMVSQGINENRIEVVGLGGTRPIASNDTQAGREMNRRVEFVIIR